MFKDRPKDNIQPGYAVGRSSIYEQTAGLVTLTELAYEQTNLTEEYNKYKTCDAMELAYYFARDNVYTIISERPILGGVTEKHIVVFETDFLEDYKVMIKDRQPLIE